MQSYSSDLKTVCPKGTRVRIPASPPVKIPDLNGLVFLFAEIKQGFEHNVGHEGVYRNIDNVPALGRPSVRSNARSPDAS